MKKVILQDYGHLKLLYGWVVYFVMYFLTERLIPAQLCRPVHIRLDDVIPFCEWFVIPYVFWYGMLAFSLVYFALTDAVSFRRLQIYLMIVQIIAMGIYIVFPSRQDLRPEVFPRQNLLTDMVRFLYRIDTNTNVCPSMHVAFSLAMASVWGRKKDATACTKRFVYLASGLICLSTMFIKQHSAVDFFAALPVCLIAEGMVFGKCDLYRKSSTK